MTEPAATEGHGHETAPLGGPGSLANETPARPPGRTHVPFYVAAALATLLGIGGLLFERSAARASHLALADAARPVGFVPASAAEYREVRRYIGDIEPWLEARIGPQITSAYVDTMLVRPGSVVRRGEVVATLDCRKASAGSRAIAMQARAIEAQQQAVASEASRFSQLLQGGFVSANEAEQKTAETSTKQAELLATKARMTRAALEVDDCVLRAPFDGEITERLADPGVFARPGTPVAVIVDRSMVRITADVPERDFDAVSVSTPVSLVALATGARFAGHVTRRAPAADPGTRTIRLEIDVANPERLLPVRTTAELSLEVGKPVPASRIPLSCASVRGKRATLFVAEGNVARKLVVDVVGENDGELYLDRRLAPGSHVINEGRTLLKDGDRVVLPPENVKTTLKEPHRPASGKP